MFLCASLFSLLLNGKNPRIIFYFPRDVQTQSVLLKLASKLMVWKMIEDLGILDQAYTIIQ